MDLIRNDLNTFCLPGTVQVENPFEIFVAGQLFQMQSSITGIKPSHFGLGDCLSHMLPAGSVTGTPKKIVSQLISQYEKTERGYYTGVCGVLEPNGNFDSCVLIRSVYRGKRGTYCGIGAGLTTLSETKSEIQEFKLKLKSFAQRIDL